MALNEFVTMPKGVILFAEDHSIAAFVLKNQLLDLGYLPIRVNNGKEIIDKLEKAAPDFTPDIILLDYHMPVLNAEETIAKLRETRLYDHIPIIILTGDDLDLIPEKLIEQGAAAVMIKPVKPEVLQEQITILLNRA